MTTDGAIREGYRSGAPTEKRDRRQHDDDSDGDRNRTTGTPALGGPLPDGTDLELRKEHQGQLATLVRPTIGWFPHCSD
jgi:hypothetical protein